MADPNPNNESHGLSIIAEDQAPVHNQHDHHFNHDEPCRTAYHFQPPKNWMNDPNGPLVYEGIYHLFYQYNPNEPVWGGIVWGHSTSTDLINWTQQPIALSPAEPYDSKGVWSGSATILPGNKPAILYTSSGDNNNDQIQNLAFPKDLSDPYLKEWVKVQQNPVIVAPPNGNDINPSEFRDPSTAWLLPDGKWRVIIGTLINNEGVAALFKSEDFISWSKVERPLHSAEGTGMWECLDFFPVYVGKPIGADTSTIGDDVKQVLKVSLVPSHIDTYTIGRYDIHDDKYIPDEGSIEGPLGLGCDYGRYYASKSFFDSKTNRRITLGWVSEGSTQADDYIKGWSGLQSIPRTMVLDESGKQLVQWPVTELESLRYGEIDVTPRVIEGGSLIEISGITNTQADVEISFEIPELNNAEELDPSWSDPQKLSSLKGASVEGRLGPFGLLALASADLKEYTAIFFRIFKAQNKYVVLMGNDLSSSSKNTTTEKPSYGTFVDMDPVTHDLSLRTLIDHSIVESFGAKGKNCITARVYPTQAVNDKAKLYVFNYGTENVKITKLSAWSMKKAQINLPTDNSSTMN